MTGAQDRHERWVCSALGTCDEWSIHVNRLEASMVSGHSLWPSGNCLKSVQQQSSTHKVTEAGICCDTHKQHPAMNLPYVNAEMDYK